MAAPVEPPGFRRSKLLQDEGVRFFVITSNVGENVVKSVQHNVWATQRKNEQKLNEAYRTATAVILVFSVNKSGAFQGYARMRSPTGRSGCTADPFNGFGRLFDVEWLRLHDLETTDVMHLRNSLDDHRQVAYSRDGQELAQKVGSELCNLVDIRVYNEKPSEYEPVADAPPPHRLESSLALPAPAPEPPANRQVILPGPASAYPAGPLQPNGQAQTHHPYHHPYFPSPYGPGPGGYNLNPYGPPPDVFSQWPSREKDRKRGGGRGESSDSAQRGKRRKKKEKRERSPDFITIAYEEYLDWWSRHNPGAVAVAKSAAPAPCPAAYSAGPAAPSQQAPSPAPAQVPPAAGISTAATPADWGRVPMDWGRNAAEQLHQQHQQATKPPPDTAAAPVAAPAAAPAAALPVQTKKELMPTAVHSSATLSVKAAVVETKKETPAEAAVAKIVARKKEERAAKAAGTPVAASAPAAAAPAPAPAAAGKRSAARGRPAPRSPLPWAAPITRKLPDAPIAILTSDEEEDTAGSEAGDGPAEAASNALPGAAENSADMAQALAAAGLDADSDSSDLEMEEAV